MSRHSVEFVGYRAGVLTTMAFLASYHDKPTMAAELARELLQGYSARTLQRVARQEGLSFPRGFWQEHAFRRRED